MQKVFTFLFMIGFVGSVSGSYFGDKYERNRENVIFKKGLQQQRNNDRRKKEVVQGDFSPRLKKIDLAAFTKKR